jgi:hypothetical protein
MPHTWTPHYQSQHENIEICGVVVSSREEFNQFISNEFSERIRYYSGFTQIDEVLRNLKDTGFQTDGLEEVLNYKITKSDWGEYFAYHQLESSFNISIPWPSQWDKKKITHSLPGADVIGLKNENGSISFVFGEIKTSQEMRYPPQVVTKKADGLVTQLMKFEDREIISNLIKWLLIKSHGNSWEPDFSAALEFYVANDFYFSCVGILVRDTNPTIDDLACIPEQLTLRCNVSLYAFYLPEPMHDCITKSLPRGVVYADN